MKHKNKSFMHPLLRAQARANWHAGLIAARQMIQDTAIEIVDDAAQMYFRMEQELGMA